MATQNQMQSTATALGVALTGGSPGRYRAGCGADISEHTVYFIYTGQCIGTCRFCVDCMLQRDGDCLTFPGDGLSYIGSRQRGIRAALADFAAWSIQHPNLSHTAGWGFFGERQHGAEQCNGCAGLRVHNHLRVQEASQQHYASIVAAERSTSVFQPRAPPEQHLQAHHAIGRSCSICQDSHDTAPEHRTHPGPLTLVATLCCNPSIEEPREHQLICRHCAMQTHTTSGCCPFCRQLGFCPEGHNSDCPNVRDTEQCHSRIRDHTCRTLQRPSQIRPEHVCTTCRRLHEQWRNPEVTLSDGDESDEIPCLVEISSDERTEPDLDHPGLAQTGVMQGSAITQAQAGGEPSQTVHNDLTDGLAATGTEAEPGATSNNATAELERTQTALCADAERSPAAQATKGIVGEVRRTPGKIDLYKE